MKMIKTRKKKNKGKKKKHNMRPLPINNIFNYKSSTQVENFNVDNLYEKNTKTRTESIRKFFVFSSSMDYWI